MILMVENSVDAVLEYRSVDPELRSVGAKHAPVIDGKKVSVGSVLHPMTEEHYIEWVEATGKDGRVVKKFLKPGDEVVVEFCFDVVRARCYCNLHGLWKNG